MKRVMERRNLLAGLLALVVSMFVLAGTASAHSSHQSKKVAAVTLEEEHEEAACKVVASPSRMIDIGEFAHHSSVATILEVECQARYAEKEVRIASNELWAKCDKHLEWDSSTGGGAETKEYKAPLDDAGNAEVVVWGGPSCAAEGGALVTVDLESGTHPTTTTEVTIEEPRVTKPGITLYPEPTAGHVGAIEDSVTSTILGLAVIEFPPGYAEETVSVTDRQLFEKCQIAPHLLWFGEGTELLADGPEAHVTLDDDGNAFVVFLGHASCKSGTTLFEASLEEPPFTTYQGSFNVYPPQSTFP